MSDTNKKYLLASCGTHVAVLGPDGLECARFTPGIEAPTYSECTHLAELRCNRLNDVGVTYRLEQWRVGVPGAIPGHTMRPHWQSNSIYFDKDKAITDRDRFNAEGGQWRVVKQTREVVP